MTDTHEAVRLADWLEADACDLEAPRRAAADVLDGKRWRYAIADGGNQSMNFLDIYDDWDGDGAFVDAFDKAMNSDAAIAASGRKP